MSPTSPFYLFVIVTICSVLLNVSSFHDMTADVAHGCFTTQQVV